MRRLAVMAALCAAILSPRHAAAIDVWDLSGSDGNNGTDNELASGSEQLHDLQNNAGVADQDWFLVGQQPFSSYEVIVDGLTEEVASIPATQAADALQLDLVDSAGALINSGYAFSGIGAARTLRFRNTTASEITNQYVRVMTGTDGCENTCTTNAEYRILFRETTLLVPRFNNTGSQNTVLILQNGSNTSISGTARFWNAAGTSVGTSAFTIAARNTLVLATSTVAGGQSGSITIDHTGRYGAISGKAVALEPSTGFTFDTPVLNKIN